MNALETLLPAGRTGVEGPGSVPLGAPLLKQRIHQEEQGQAPGEKAGNGSSEQITEQRAFDA